MPPPKQLMQKLTLRKKPPDAEVDAKSQNRLHAPNRSDFAVILTRSCNLNLKKIVHPVSPQRTAGRSTASSHASLRALPQSMTGSHLISNPETSPATLHLSTNQRLLPHQPHSPNRSDFAVILTRSCNLSQMKNVHPVSLQRTAGRWTASSHASLKALPQITTGRHLTSSLQTASPAPTHPSTHQRPSPLMHTSGKRTTRPPPLLHQKCYLTGPLATIAWLLSTPRHSSLESLATGLLKQKNSRCP